MNLWNLTTRNIGLDIGLYLRIPKGLLRRPNERGVCLCKQETRVDACGGLFQNHRHNLPGLSQLLAHLTHAVSFSSSDK
jgi:hypothetical protein